MLAAVFTGGTTYAPWSTPPPPPEAGWVTVLVSYCGICWRRHRGDHSWPEPRADATAPVDRELLPVTLGHEGTGVVVARGDGVQIEDGASLRSRYHYVRDVRMVSDAAHSFWRWVPKWVHARRGALWRPLPASLHACAVFPGTRRKPARSSSDSKSPFGRCAEQAAARQDGSGRRGAGTSACLSPKRT